MKLKFCGAAREVTGSCHLITLDNGYSILLDCGMFQGRAENLDELNSDWYFNPSEIDVLILSHAHIDHCGRIPKLVKDGFRGNIYCTHATRDLAAIMLMDTAHIQERDAEYQNKKLDKKRAKHPGQKFPRVKPIYSAGDVAQAMKLFVSFSYDRWIEIVKGVKVLFTDAGHILGSASVNLVIKQGGDELRVAFSGDIGRPSRPILRDPQEMWPADVIITESTYGDKLHIEKPAEKDHFLEVIRKTCLEKRGKLIIPAFSLGRTQELVYILDQLVNEGILPNIPVFVDSPLAINATDIYKAHSECFDDELHAYIVNDPDPFGFKRLSYITDANDSKQLNNSKEPSIIISAAGMVNAGRIQHHVFNNIENPKATILLVGYCSPSTPGGQLQRGATELKLFGELLKVNAQIEIMDSFSAHGDQKEMHHFLSNQTNTCKHLYLVHGDYDTQLIYKDYLRQNGFSNIEIPELRQEVTI
jgi:metallo-beta-lactamase family protein